MNKKIIGVIAGVALLIGGGVAFWQLQDDEPELAQETTENGISQEEAAQLALVAENMASVSYVATITGSTPEGDIDSVLEFDGEGSYSFTANQAGQTTQFVVTPEATYSCDGDQCFELPSDQTDELFTFDINDFTYDEGTLTEFVEVARNIGQEDCPAGTCDVWEIEQDGEITRLYIDTDANRISQASGSGGDGEFTIVYNYRDVTITVPENVQPFPTFEQ